MIVGNVRGEITGFDADGTVFRVSGWATTTAPEAGVELICVHEGSPLAQVCGDQDANGVFALPAGGSPFELQLPLASLSHVPTPRNTVFLCRGTGAALPILSGGAAPWDIGGDGRGFLDVFARAALPHRDGFAPSDAVVGGGWLESFGAVVGWAVRTSDDVGPATVSLDINGTPAGTLTADLLYRPSDREKAVPAGFRFGLKPDQIEFGENRLRILDASTGLPICDDLLLRGADRVRGHVEHVLVNGIVASVKGWARDMAHPTKSAAIDVSVRGRLVASGLARQARPDVRDAIGGTASVGFSIDVIASVLALEDLAVTLSGRAIQFRQARRPSSSLGSTHRPGPSHKPLPKALNREDQRSKAPWTASTTDTWRAGLSMARIRIGRSCWRFLSMAHPIASSGPGVFGRMSRTRKGEAVSAAFSSSSIRSST